LSNPEFLAEGTAVNDLLRPDRVLIGSSLTASGITAASILRNVYAAWVDPKLIVTVNVWSSELAKLVANAMLAQRISSINTISAICDATGADINDVARVVGLDTRIGNKFLKAGIGFGGSCFKKDVLALSYLARSLHLPKVADYWTAVLDINDFQQDRFTKKIIEQLHGTLQGKKITILGYAFKQNTNDCRESPAIKVVKVLSLENTREIAIFDYGCTPAEICRNVNGYLEQKSVTGILEPEGGVVEAYGDVYEACKGASAILILTPWDMFRYPPKLPTPLTQEGLQTEQTKMTSRTVCITDFDVLTTLPSHVYGVARLFQEPPCPVDCEFCELLDPVEPTNPRNKEPLDWQRVASVMREPRHVFDGRNVVDPAEMKSLGFRVESLGRTNGGDGYGYGSRMSGMVPVTPF
jgi:UDPglucose 6-dehydrogenase